MSLGLSVYDSSSSDEESVPQPRIKNKVKIVVPITNTPSSDEESEPPPQKKANAGSSLFSKLPPPRNTIGDGKQMNRTFVPYIFTKKANAKPVDKTNVKLVRNSASQSGIKTSQLSLNKEKNESSDDESGEVSFFSFVDKNEIGTSDQTKDTLIAPTDKHPVHSANFASESIVSHPVAEQDSASLVSSYSPIQPHGPAGYHQSPMPSTQKVVPTNQPYYTGYTQSPTPTAVHEINNSVANRSEHSLLLDDRFKRIQGKTNRKEKVQFIEVKADSALEGNKELLLKQISEEKNIHRTSHSKKRNSDMPSSTSRRKHQMSYLIHQAKEREIELKNAWAEGHAARAAARNRYGF